MSIPDESLLSRAVRSHSAWFACGFALGLVTLGFWGWWASRTDYHSGFIRFYPAISPETNYYPSVNEMASIARARCRRDQVLVVVGGNSILQGVWQPPGEVWTAHLQEALGGRFAVVNLALRGASPTDGGAVVAETLRHEFPRQIYVADESPFSAVDPLGHNPYQYLFWQAYFRGELIHTSARQAEISEILLDSGQRAGVLEMALQTQADRMLHFEDLWNFMAYTRFNTVPSMFGEYFPRLLTPRNRFADTEPDAYDFQAVRYPASALDAEMHIVRNTTGLFYVRTPQGEWKMPRFIQRRVADNYAVAFPDELKGRTLILVSRSSPYYRRRLSETEKAREDQGFGDAVRAWQTAGYAAMQYGRDYSDDDFGDRTHLSKSGGRKLADSAAPVIKEMAIKLGYFR